VNEEIWVNAELQEKKATVDQRVHPEMTVLEERQGRQENQDCPEAREILALLVLLDYKALRVQQDLRAQWD